MEGRRCAESGACRCPVDPRLPPSGGAPGVAAAWVARGAARCLLQHASPAELRARRPLPHRWLERDQGPCGAAVPWRGSRTGYNGPHALLGAGCDSKCPLTRNGGPPHRRSYERQRRHLADGRQNWHYFRPGRKHLQRRLAVSASLLAALLPLANCCIRRGASGSCVQTRSVALDSD